MPSTAITIGDSPTGIEDVAISDVANKAAPPTTISEAFTPRQLFAQGLTKSWYVPLHFLRAVEIAVRLEPEIRKL